MGKSHRRLLGVLFLFPSVVITVCWGCQGNQPPLTWDSPKMIEVEKEYESLRDRAFQTRGDEGIEKYGSKNEKLDAMLDEIIRKRLSESDLRGLAATCGTLPLHEADWGLFTHAVLDRMVECFVASGDRDSLVKMLSTRCPTSFQGNRFLGYQLVTGGKALKDPILVLGDAYSKCKIPEVRHQIAIVVREAFTSSGVHGKDDADFVENAMKWYEMERANLVVNEAHRPLGSLVPEGHSAFRTPAYEYIPPLFVKE
jgi:hypothetical protein